MKYSLAIAACVAPLAMAKAVRNSYPVKRDPQGLSVTFRNGMAGFGITETSLTEVILIWANPGGGAATTTINQQVTVTQTVVAGGGAVATPGVVAGVPGSPAVAAPPSPVAGGIGATHSVTVGGPAGLVFNPDNIQAAVGDMVIFTFLGNNHTATQSAFATPCDVLAGGMDSGFMSNPNSTVVPAPQVAMQVMVADPLWFFCAQNGHCGKGMTFSINPTADKTHAMFQQMAIAQRGQGGGSAITGGAPAAAAPPPAAAPAAAPPAADPAALAPLPGAPGVDAASSAALAPLPGASAPVAAVGGGQGVVTGSGTLNPDGSCTCSVSCAAGAFPNIAEQGVNAFGGMSGSLPVGAVGA